MEVQYFTSESHPLQVDFFDNQYEIAIGMTMCPVRYSYYHTLIRT
jgi:hypothetical protein